MQADPVDEWRRLTALYSEMGEIELRELAGQIDDLTPAARQILRDEMKKRGISNEQSAPSAPNRPVRTAAVHWEPPNYTYRFSPMPDENEGPHEYTWKTPLSTCDTNREAFSIGLALKRAGIDSWIEAPESRMGLTGSRILVAADQLEEAKAIIAQPIPQDVTNEMDDEVNEPAYELPVCPKCRAADPTLESVDPSNSWLCESCGHRWSHPVADESTRPTHQPGR
ncbi:MAG TPA: hypothetical protein VKB47_16330 [Terracidiphilus sp.]|nr:hypothetical protein [Terracidiphilus sp.]